MQKFKNMKLKTKLIILTVFITLISCISGFMTMSYINKATARYDTALKYYGIAQGDVGKAMVAASETRRVIRDAMIYRENDTFLKLEYTNFKQSYFQYEKNVLDKAYGEEEKVITAAISGLSGSYFEKANEILAIISESDPSQDSWLQKKVETELDPAFDAMYENYTALMQLKTDTADLEVADLARTNQRTFIVLYAAMILSMVIAIGSGILVAIRISNPVKQLLQMSQKIIDGNLDIHLSVERKDEVGQLAQRFALMSDNLTNIINDTNQMLTQLSNGRFGVHSDCQELYVGQYRNMLSTIQHIDTNLCSTLRQIETAASEVELGSQQVADGAQALAQGTTEQASAIEELLATITDVSAQAEAAGAYAQDASAKSAESGVLTAECQSQMQEMVAAMDEISATSKEIGKIVKTIEDIAFQTNILSLNASIEAARAGTAGRGFSVVANEVRNLAAKSTEASQNTTDLVEASLAAVEKGVLLASKTAKQLDAVSKHSQVVVDMVGEISSGAHRQTSSLQQISIGVDQVSDVVQNNAATAEESAAASEELSGQATGMKDLISHFSLDDSDMPVIEPEEAPSEEESLTDTAAAAEAPAEAAEVPEDVDGASEEAQHDAPFGDGAEAPAEDDGLAFGETDPSPTEEVEEAPADVPEDVPAIPTEASDAPVGDVPPVQEIFPDDPPLESSTADDPSDKY